MLNKITEDAKAAVLELLNIAKLERGDIFVVGCSSSKVLGSKPGTNSSPEIAKAVFDGIYPLLKEKGIYIAAQCCEHLNRAIVIEKSAVKEYGLETVNVLPQPKAGGSFATCTYACLENPAVVEEVKAHAGIDIGGVLIGMQLKKTAVPVALTKNTIGEAPVIAARTRPKFIGGSRAVYDNNLL
ncbi:UPF0340 protein [Clostridia bacterium]|nr:UPF0340 protein [Clostridia bacterium]